MQSNLVAIRGTRPRTCFPRPTARDRERSLGLRRPTMTRAPRTAVAAGDGAPRALAAALRPRRATIAAGPRTGWTIARRGSPMTWSRAAAPRGVRGRAGSPWPA
ncbi:MAG TPA: hypothetical protein VFW92_07150 [Candidatus Limnocylindrales bacterium]|nr:hypothetical protein [Candidatus Limnocylindrales bacterium]